MGCLVDSSAEDLDGRDLLWPAAARTDPVPTPELSGDVGQASGTGRDVPDDISRGRLSWRWRWRRCQLRTLGRADSLQVIGGPIKRQGRGDRVPDGRRAIAQGHAEAVPVAIEQCRPLLRHHPSGPCAVARQGVTGAKPADGTPFSREAKIGEIQGHASILQASQTIFLT